MALPAAWTTVWMLGFVLCVTIPRPVHSQTTPEGRQCPTENPGNRINCGYSGITQLECKGVRHCCYNEVGNSPYCYYPSLTGLITWGCFKYSGSLLPVTSVQTNVGSETDCFKKCFEDSYTHVGLQDTNICICGNSNVTLDNLKNAQAPAPNLCYPCDSEKGISCGNDSSSVFIYKFEFPVHKQAVVNLLKTRVRREEECPETTEGKYGWDCTLDCTGCAQDELCDRLEGCSSTVDPNPSTTTTTATTTVTTTATTSVTVAATTGNPAASTPPCSAGFFGATCSPCHCANPKSCNSTSGVCDDQECAPGYKSDSPILKNCQTACSTGSFGPNCSEECNCGANTICDPKTGCTGRCSPGFSNAPKCDVQIITTGGGNSENTGTSTPTPDADILIMYIVPAVGGLAGLLVLILIILICVFVKRRNRQKKKEKQKQLLVESPQPGGFDDASRNSMLGVKPVQNSVKAPRPESEMSNAPAMPGDDYTPITKDPPADLSLSVASLEAHIKKVRETEASPFKDEYEKIPEGQTAAWDYGIRKNVHREKNRFGNIVAYDHSRVKISRKKDDASEYINANYIDGYKQPNAFIATQGPMPQTVDDFWRLCWEYDVPIIVMVTNCIENGRQKSEQYWPDVKATKDIGGITVTTAEEERFSDFIIRTMTVKKADDPVRKLKHFQFTGWPDHGVPRQATPLLTLRRRVRAEMATKPGITGPTIVHCSAGVGRSGTFIAVDYLMNQAEEESKIDVFGCVWGMRYQRVNMVQTWDQYNFIYDALLEAVTVGATTIPCYRYEEIYPDWEKPDPTTNINKLEQQLRILDVVKVKGAEHEFETALKTNNKSKNRSEDILPANFYRPFLQTRVDGTTDYINAVFVQGYYKREAFLITQAPLADTGVDFWRMVYDYDCRSIICLQDYKKTKTGDEPDDEKESLPPVWPESGSMNFGPMLITFVKTNTDPAGIVTTEVSLKLGRKDKENRQVMVFTLAEFPEGDDSLLPEKAQIAMKEAVQRWQQQSGDQTVVVMCKYGVERCGVYCALDYVIDMMGVEQEVDVFQAVRQVQMSRPQLVHNIEQYKYLYTAAKTYMDINMAYSNFQ